MENIEVSRIFNDIADILEIKEENSFRIRSYRKAAQIIEDLSENLKDIAKVKALQNIPGIGQSLSEKIEEIIKTGDCKFHKQLIKESPAKLVELMRIPGLGAKMAKQLNEKLGIATIEELEKKCEEGRLRDLEGMGIKTEEKILKGIKQYRQRCGRYKLSEALPYAQTIVNILKDIKEVGEVNVAGSLRRMKETIGDIDILVIGGNPSIVMDTFTSMKEVKEILAKGDTKSSVVLKSGIQVDVRVLKPESYGAALCYFTGSKEHNIAIREIGKKMGLKISEYGVFNVKSSKQTAGKTEEEVYKSVKLSFIPPEIRENTGEIEAAKKNKLPKLIEQKDLAGELHIHSSHSDGGHTIEEMAKAGKNFGYSYIAITDHSKALRIANGLNSERLLKQIEEIERINKRIKDFYILTGIEVDILSDGSLDLPDEVLSMCEVVIAAIHSKFNMKKAEITKRVLDTIDNKNVNIIAHPTGRLINEREAYDIDLEQIMIKAQKHNVALELNSFADRLDLNDVHLRQAKELGVKVAISTDAHNTMQLSHIKYGIATAKRGWIEPGDVINTYPLNKLRKFLIRFAHSTD